jgi:hypothetical protein
MLKINANFSRLVLKKETVRTLGDHELAGASAGWECSVTASGKIMCNQVGTDDTLTGEP